MLVGIDVTGLFWKYKTGVQNYYYGLIEGLQRLKFEREDTCFAFIDRSIHDSHSLGFIPDKRLQFRSATPLKFLPTFRNFSSERLVGQCALVWNRGVRVLRSHFLNQARHKTLFEGIDVLQVWNWDIKMAPNAKHVITIPDVIPILFPDFYGLDFLEATNESLRFARDSADAVVAISQQTKQDLVNVAGINPEKITVVYPGVRRIFHPVGDSPERALVLEKYGIEHTPYLLSVGFLDPRKNIGGLVRAFEKLKEDPNFEELCLVLAGPESGTTRRVLEEIGSSKVRDRIRVTGYVSDEELVLLMNGASVFVYCSLYEGFGFPVLEAMACGVPVVTSNQGSLAEISGDAALLADPEDIDQIAESIGRLLVDHQLRAVLRERGFGHVRQFRWEDWASGHLQVYRSCHGYGCPRETSG